jgi:hypothetical protein
MSKEFEKNVMKGTSSPELVEGQRYLWEDNRS